MRYSTEPKYRNTLKDTLFSFDRKFGDKYCNKNRNRCCENCLKKSSSKTVEATGDLIGNKIADKITSLGKPKEKTKKVKEIYIPPENRQQIIDGLKLF